MIIFSLSEVSISKALGPDTPSTSSSVTIAGRPRGGPGSAPIGGKYIHREWNTQKKKWEYDKSDKPHPAKHGIEHMGSMEEGHSLEMPEHLHADPTPSRAEHVGPDVERMEPPEAKKAQEAAWEAHQEELKSLYSQTRKSIFMPGMKFSVPDPSGKGDDLHFEVVGGFAKDGNHPHGYGIFAHEAPSTDPETGEEVRGKRKTKDVTGGSKGAGSGAALEKWIVQQKFTEEVKDPETGAVIYTIKPNLGSIDKEADLLKPSTVARGNLRNWLVIWGPGSSEYQKGSTGSSSRAEYSTHASAKHALKRHEQARLTEQGKMPSMGQLMEKKSPMQILEGQSLPRERKMDVRAKSKDKTAKIVHTKWDSPEQQKKFHNSIATELGPFLDKVLDRVFGRPGQKRYEELLGARGTHGKLLTGEKHTWENPETGAIEGSSTEVIPESVLERFLHTAITRGRYNPDAGKIEKYTIKSLVKGWTKALYEGGILNEEQYAAAKEDVNDLEGQYESGSDKKSDTVGQKFMASDGGKGEAPKGFTSPNEMFASGGEEEASAEEDAALGQKLKDWGSQQYQKLSAWEDTKDTGLEDNQDYLNMRSAIGGVQNPMEVQELSAKMRSFIQQRYDAMGTSEMADEFNQNVLHDLEKAIKSLTALFVDHIAMKAIRHDLRMQIRKAKITEPDPSHEYVRKEGMDDSPAFMYQDPRGNYVRYTNAPEGSADYSPFGGAPRVHTSEPSMDMAPEYFTPDGRKLTRAPHPAAQIQWNQNYHGNDPQNLWAGRWVNPVSGEHEYTYIDSDMRDNKKLRLHQMNRLVDIRIPHLRRYTADLLHSDQPKDNVIGLALAMVDQGRVHPVELAKLKSGDIQMHGDIIRFGRFAVHAGEKVQQIVHRMMTVRQPEDSFFSVPVLNNEPDSIIGVATDYRTIGPHYISRTLARLGTPLEGLLSYHATQTYSMQLQRCIQGTSVSLKCGQEFALLEVARRMGHDFENEPDVNPVLAQILETMIDPVVVEVMEQNARNSGDDQGGDDMSRQVVLAVPHISANLQGHTNSEKEFSGWLHAHPFHEHAETKRTYEAA